jgi:uncharacterized protein with von Willebrand factor type A (vWA) domain
MQETIHRFVRFLRLAGVRVSVAEVVDAVTAATQPGVLADRETLRGALLVTLIKDRRDRESFETVFDAFFSLQPVWTAEPDTHSHAHDDLVDEGALKNFTLTEEPSQTPGFGHSHDKPKDIRRYFDPKDMAQQYNLHQEADKVDLAALSDEMVLSADRPTTESAAPRVQIETSHLHGATMPHELTTATGAKLDTNLSIAEEAALMDWLAAGEDPELPPEVLARMRTQIAGIMDKLPEMLRKHLAAFAALREQAVEGAEPARQAAVQAISEADRARLEETLRELVRSMSGALTHRRRPGARGKIDSARTMRQSMRYEGIPFRPVSVVRAQDRPRLVILAVVSLSVRLSTRFTLQVVHGLQRLVPRVRTFAFVDQVAEVTDVFADHGVEDALGLLMGGDILDVDANSDYGQVLVSFLEQYGSEINRRTTVLILGDGRGNGKDPHPEALEELSRRAREVIWLTPEARYSWVLAGSDMPVYESLCSRVEVVPDLASLDRVAQKYAGANAKGGVHAYS